MIRTIKEEREEYNQADDVEREYLLAIRRATENGDNDTALELSTGLSEYRESTGLSEYREHYRT